MNLLESDNIVSGLHVGHSFAHGLDDTGALMTEDDGEGSLRIFPGKCVRIYLISASLLP